MRSASSLERVEACPASTALPHAPYSGEAAEQGTENHRVIEEVITAGGVPEKLADLWEGALTVETEVAYVIDVAKRTGRRLGKLPTARDYGEVGPTEIAMTLDVLLTKPGEVVIIDWKSRTRVTPSERNLQIAAQMCAVEAVHGMTGWAGLVYLDDMYRDLAPFSVFDSGARWSRLARLVEREGTGQPVAGSHCRYCPALVHCPTQRAALAAFSDGPLGVESMPVARIGELWVQLDTIEQMLEQARAAARERARREPIPLPSGKYLRLVESSRTSNDARAMEARLRELGEDTERFKKTTTYTQVREGK